MLPSQHRAKGGSKAQNQITASTPTPSHPTREAKAASDGLQTNQPQHLPPSHLSSAGALQQQAGKRLHDFQHLIFTAILNDVE